ncbi:MAG: hypothetical protein K2H65_06315 [Bacteroidales bacterium]|nr:hypothetical protein [Bacteroidales bacterium]
MKITALGRSIRRRNKRKIYFADCFGEVCVAWANEESARIFHIENKKFAFAEMPPIFTRCAATGKDSENYLLTKNYPNTSPLSENGCKDTPKIIKIQ